MPKSLTVRQAAIELGCTLKYVFDLLYAGRLAGATKQGRTWQIPASAVERILKEREARNAAR